MKNAKPMEAIQDLSSKVAVVTGNYFDEHREAVKRRAVRRLEKPGYRVEVALLVAPAG